MDDDSVISHSALVAQFDGDDALLVEVAELFLSDYPRQLADIRSAIERDDAPGVEMAAHTLKGAVSNFAASAAREAAGRLETLGRENTVTDAMPFFVRLDLEMRRLHAALRILIDRVS